MHILRGRGEAKAPKPLKPKQKQVEKIRFTSQVNSYFFSYVSMKTSFLQTHIPTAQTLINIQIRNWTGEIQISCKNPTVIQRTNDLLLYFTKGKEPMFSIFNGIFQVSNEVFLSWTCFLNSNMCGNG